MPSPRLEELVCLQLFWGTGRFGSVPNHNLRDPTRPSNFMLIKRPQTDAMDRDEGMSPKKTKQARGIRGVRYMRARLIGGLRK